MSNQHWSTSLSQDKLAELNDASEGNPFSKIADLIEMWTALERYQPYADEDGHGESWKRMTTERTVDAVERARFALMEIAGSSAWAEVAVAADAADDAVWAAPDPEAERHAARAIECINKAMETK